MVFEPRRVDTVVSCGADAQLVGHIDVTVLVDGDVPVQPLDLVHHVLIALPRGPAQRACDVGFPTLASGRGPGLKALGVEVLATSRPAPDDGLLAVISEIGEADRTVAVDGLAAFGLFGFYPDLWGSREYILELVAQEAKLVDELERRMEDFIEDLGATNSG